MVLHLREDDRVALADVAATPAVGDQVHGLGCIAGPDDLVGGRRVDEPGDLYVRGLVLLGGRLADLVDGAVDVRVVLAVVAVHRLDDGAGLRASGRRVQVDQLFAVGALLEDREVKLPGQPGQAAREGLVS